MWVAPTENSKVLIFARILLTLFFCADFCGAQNELRSGFKLALLDFVLPGSPALFVIRTLIAVSIETLYILFSF